MKEYLRNLRPFDFVAVGVAVILTVVTGIAAYGRGSVASHVHVETPDGTYVYDLNTDVQVEALGPLGVTKLEIADGRARVTESPCREQICVNAGDLKVSGDWTACLPNRIFIEVTGNEVAEFDAVSY